MRTMRHGPLHEKRRVEGNPAVRGGIEFHHPALDSVGIERRIDCAIERVGEVDTLTITAYLDHLRPAAEGTVPRARMRGPRHDTADANLAGEVRTERVGYVVLLQITSAPAGHV